jgi:hypothetical protein
VIALLFLLALAGPAAPDGGSDADGPGASVAADADETAAAQPDAGDAPISPAPAAPGHPAEARGKLSGRVLERGSRLAVPAATILVDGKAWGESRGDGQFDLRLPCGPHTITLRSPGFETLTLHHDACADRAPLLLRLSPRLELPVYETVVTATPDAPTVSLRGTDLTATPGSLGDPFRTIESLPGVAAVAWPAPIYAVRGANPGNTGYFLDDVQMPALFHLALGPAVIHPYFFASMDFYPGGYPARYGRYVAGLVTAQTRAAADDGIHATADVRLFDAGGLASAPFPDGNGGVTAAIRYSYTGAMLSLVRSDLHLSYWDYQARADRRVRDWHWTLLLLGSSDRLSYQDKSHQVLDYLLQFHRASLRARTSVGEGQLLATIVAGADHSTAPIIHNFPISVHAYSLMPRLTYQRPGPRVDLEVGLDGHLQWFWPTSSFDSANASDLGRQRTAALGAAYVSAAVRLGKRLTVTPGLRLDSYTISGISKMAMGPRLSARLLLDEKTWLTLSGGRFSQPPSLAIQIPGTENFGLALYGLQTSWQGALGLGTQHLASLEVEVTGYLQRYVLSDLRDPALFKPDPLASDFLVRRDARSYGLEIMLRRPLSQRLHGWLSYTWSQNQRALGDGVVGPSDWDQRHIVNLVLAYRRGAYTFATRGHLNTGRPVLISVAQTGSAQAEVFTRLPTYYQVDLRIERRFVFDAYTVALYLEVVNASASREVIGLYQTGLGDVSQDSYRIILPSLGVHGEF